MDDRQRVIARCEKNYSSGKGVHLSHVDLGHLMAKDEPTAPTPEQTDVTTTASVLQHSGERLDVQIRWLILRDMPEVLRIKQESFEFPWTEEDFLCCLRQRNCIGMVAEYEHKVIALMVYELHKSRLDILNFAVDSSIRRKQVGTQMVERLIDKLSKQKRKQIRLHVRESNLGALLFFKRHRFLAVRLIEDHFDNGENAIEMRYRIGKEKQPRDEYSPTNRISLFDTEG